MTRQLAFDLPARPALGRENFLVSPSTAGPVEMLDNWHSWPRGRMLLLGPTGSGKSHLAHVWATETGAAIVDACSLASCDLPSLSDRRFVVSEDADRIASTPGAEVALFHLHNLLDALGGHLLITARTPPGQWGLNLPDLASRMQGMAVAQLSPPDDPLLAAVLVKLFADRQLAVAPTVIPYLLLRMERSFAAARDLVARLDATALAQGRPITRQLAAALLDRPDAEA